jgi:hypothetical protein
MIGAACLLLGVHGSLAQAAPAESNELSAAALAGRTLSAVAYLSRSADHGGGSLTRLMFQAYLRPDGTALARVWDVAADAYTRPAQSHWTVTGSQLCLAVPTVSPTLCLDVHVWGPRIAGSSITPYAMLDGDLKQGNLIAVDH